MTGRLVRRVGAGCLAATLLAACRSGGSEAAPTPSPIASVSSSPSPSASVSKSPRDVVAARYAEFWAVFWTAAATNAADDPRLLDLTTGAERTKLDGIFSTRRTHGRSGYGTSTPHVRSITVNGAVATVVDCHDSSRAGVKDDASGKRLTRGSATEDITVTMRLVNGRWRVSDIAVRTGGC